MDGSAVDCENEPSFEDLKGDARIYAKSWVGLQLFNKELGEARMWLIPVKLAGGKGWWNDESIFERGALAKVESVCMALANQLRDSMAAASHDEGSCTSIQMPEMYGAHKARAWGRSASTAPIEFDDGGYAFTAQIEIERSDAKLWGAQVESAQQSLGAIHPDLAPSFAFSGPQARSMLAERGRDCYESFVQLFEDLLDHTQAWDEAKAIEKEVGSSSSARKRVRIASRL